MSYIIYCALLGCSPVESQPVCHFSIQSSTTSVESRLASFGETFGMSFHAQAHGVGVGYMMYGLKKNGIEILARNPFQPTEYILSVYGSSEKQQDAIEICSALKSEFPDA